MIGSAGNPRLIYAITPIAFRKSYINNADLDNGDFLDIYL